MKGIRQLKSGFADPRMKELIDTLWREYYGLYVEKYNRDPDNWLLSAFSPDIDFGQAIGQDHLISGNRSIAIGQGLVTRSLLETVLGAYNLIAEGQNPEEWNPADLLFTLANGPDEDSRSNAIEVFKSGLIRLFNAILIGKYEHGELEPIDGMLQFTPEKSLQVRENDQWNTVSDKFYRHTQSAPSRVWEIHHNLGKFPSVSVTDFEGNEYEGEANRIDENTMVLTFSAPIAGYADLN